MATWAVKVTVQPVLPVRGHSILSTEPLVQTSLKEAKDYLHFPETFPVPETSPEAQDF